MINRLIKLVLIVFSVVFIVPVLTIFTADRCYSMSKAVEKDKITTEKAMDLLNIAAKLDFANANLYFEKYKILDKKAKNEQNIPRLLLRQTRYEIRKQQLPFIKQCIQLCPFSPKYHIHYAFTLMRMGPRRGARTRELALSELRKAAKLKPYSELYRRMYEKYRRKLQ